MLIKHLKSYAIKELRVKIIVLIILIITLVIMYIYNKASSAEAIELEKKSKSTQDNVSSKKELVSISQESIKIWEAEAKKVIEDRSGIKLKATGNIIDELKNNNHLKDLNINLSSPEIRKDLGVSRYSQVAFSTGSMNFNTYTDIDALRFIDNFIRKTPGFIHIKMLSLTSAGILNKSISIEDANKLVSVKLEFLLEDIQDLKIENNLDEKNKIYNTLNFPNPMESNEYK